MGQTSSTLTILRWRKKTGERIKQGDVLVEVETDKATLEVESYLDGILLEILRPSGENVEVGDPIAVIGSNGEALSNPGTDSVNEGKSGVNAATSRTRTTAAKGAPSSAHTVGQPTSIPGGRQPGPGKVLATPPARKLATEKGIDIALVHAHSPGGLITTEDVLAFAQHGQKPSSSERTTKDRTAVARRVAEAFSTIPHIYLTTSVDMSRAQETLERIRTGKGKRTTYTHVILRALGRTLERIPELNCIWQSSGTPLPLNRTNIGLVVAGDQQLLIASILQPHKQSLVELTGQVVEVVQRARSGKLRGDDLTPVAVSLSNLGMYAVESFQAIIDVDQCAMISVGAIADRVVAVDRAIAIRPMMTVTVAADHRVVDGVEVARFLDELKRDLEATSD